MAATKALKDALYKRANGHCECKMRSCDHHRAGSKCPRSLVPGYWQVHRLNTSGDYTLSNTKAYCKTCHKNTRSYGRG